jgi:hypothetical protein
VVTPPDDHTRAEAEALALEILVDVMRTGTPSQKLAAALAVHPRARPVEPTGTGTEAGQRGGTLYVVAETGEVVDAEEVRPHLPGNVVPRPPRT